MKQIVKAGVIVALIAGSWCFWARRSCVQKVKKAALRPWFVQLDITPEKRDAIHAYAHELKKSIGSIIRNFLYKNGIEPHEQAHADSAFFVPKPPERLGVTVLSLSLNVDIKDEIRDKLFSQLSTDSLFNTSAIQGTVSITQHAKLFGGGRDEIAIRLDDKNDILRTVHEKVGRFVSENNLFQKHADLSGSSLYGYNPHLSVGKVAYSYVHHLLKINTPAYASGRADILLSELRTRIERFARNLPKCPVSPLALEKFVVRSGSETAYRCRVLG